MKGRRVKTRASRNGQAQAQRIIKRKNERLRCPHEPNRFSLCSFILTTLAFKVKRLKAHKQHFPICSLSSRSRPLTSSLSFFARLSLSSPKKTKRDEHRACQQLRSVRTPAFSPFPSPASPSPVISPSLSPGQVLRNTLEVEPFRTPLII